MCNSLEGQSLSNWPKQTIQEVADGIFVVLHGQGEVGVSNAVFVIEGKRALVVDTMTFPEMAVHMADAIAHHGAHADIVLNTHHHIDHMGGNSVFGDAHILAHPASIRAVEQLGLPAAIYDRLMPQFRGLFNHIPLRIPAALSYQDQPELPRGGELHMFTPAHTPADVAVWFPDSEVLLTGDIGFFGVTPLSVNGFLSGWIGALNTLIALKPKVVVPGHGRIGSVNDLVTLHNYFAALLHLGQKAVAEKVSLQDALSQFDPGPLSEWIEGERHIINLERAMQEASGEITRSNLAVMPRSARKP